MAVNTNRQGANFELDTMHYLSGCRCEFIRKVPAHVGWRGFGYDSLRSSGSRGKVDVVAVSDLILWGGDETSPGPLLFIQCKITNPLISPAERRGVVDLARRAAALPLVSYRTLDIVTGRVRPHFRRLTGSGPKDWLPWEPGEDN